MGESRPRLSVHMTEVKFQLDQLRSVNEIDVYYMANKKTKLMIRLM